MTKKYILGPNGEDILNLISLCFGIGEITLKECILYNRFEAAWSHLVKL